MVPQMTSSIVPTIYKKAGQKKRPCGGRGVQKCVFFIII